MSHLSAEPWRLPLRRRGPVSHLTAQPWPLPDVAAGVGLGPVAVAGALTLTAAAPAFHGVADTATVALDAVPATATTYTVARGDTLSGIALRNGTTVRALMDANGITDPNRILVGQRLQLSATSPADGTTVAPTPSAAHVVRRGEALSTIAARYDVTVRAIADANGIANPNRIVVGQRLTIPGRDAPAPPAAQPEAVPAPAEQYHTVGAGESLSVIASAYGTTVQALVDANGIANPNLVTVGQGLRVPGAAAPQAPPCPVPGASYVDDYGYVKPSGRVHEGVDLFAPRGTPVGAPVAGVATHVTGPRAGNQVTFDGDDGARYYLTHLDTFGNAGRVAAGETIGTVGSTGNARGTSPHVHFERHVDGEVTNPYPWLRDRC